MAPCLPDMFSSDDEMFSQFFKPQKGLPTRIPMVKGKLSGVIKSQSQRTMPRRIPTVKSKLSGVIKSQSQRTPIKKREKRCILTARSSSLKNSQKNLKRSYLKMSRKDESIYQSSKGNISGRKKRGRLQAKCETGRIQAKSEAGRKKRRRLQAKSEDEYLSISNKTKIFTPSKMIIQRKTSSQKKKTYEMPGQKKDTPHELDGGRIFYQSLRKQIPESEMAEEYLLSVGLLPRHIALKIVERNERAKNKKSISVGGVFTPVKRTRRKKAAKGTFTPVMTLSTRRRKPNVGKMGNGQEGRKISSRNKVRKRERV